MNNKFIKNSDYREWFVEIKKRILVSQQKAALKVNHELLSLYWFIGQVLDQTQTDWGDKFIDNLSRDLKIEFPDMKGFSKSNLKSMRRWYSYHNEHLTIGQQAVDQLDFKLELGTNKEFGQQAVDQLLDSVIEDTESYLNQK